MSSKRCSGSQNADADVQRSGRDVQQPRFRPPAASKSKDVRGLPRSTSKAAASLGGADRPPTRRDAAVDFTATVDIVPTPDGEKTQTSTRQTVRAARRSIRPLRGDLWRTSSGLWASGVISVFKSIRGRTVVHHTAMDREP